jgi:hypothetical protein
MLCYELVSGEMARDAYCVAIDPATLEIDQVRTAELSGEKARSPKPS